LNSSNETFYTQAMSRIARFMVAIALVAIVVSLSMFGWRSAVGIVAGCAVGALSFGWLKRIAIAIAERATNMGRSQSGFGVGVRFVLRYGLVAALAYVILSVSPASLKGFFAGLFLPIAAIACEAAYQAYVIVIKGFEA
jgi:ATP synthase I chain